ncbi:MAG: SIS domain-containing protein [Candidatus Latescibacterota bacterium]|nr:SIS domain-containing protein [Candidatus Latescibacterota bacterium]
MNKDFIADYLDASSRVLNNLDHVALNEIVRVIVSLRERGGRLFILGVGGSAANAAHAVNDFRKLAHIETYAPTDNVSELTARVNDEGWETVFSSWLAGSRLNENDGVMVFSVGGGDAEKCISVNLIRALEYAKEKSASIIGIVGRDGGVTAQIADACVIIPTENEELVTPLAESYQALIWHMLVSHPEIQVAPTKW